MSTDTPKLLPPRWARQLLRWYCAPHLLEEIEGDLKEEFEYQLQRTSPRKARLDYIRSVLGFIKPFALKRKKNSHYSFFHMNMFRHYLVVGVRSLRKNAGYSFINIAGLAFGLTAFILIFLWVRNELSYDRFNERADQIYRVVENQYYANNDVFPVAVTPGPLGPYLKETYPDITNATRLMQTNFLLRSGELAFNEFGMMADAAFLEIFTLQFLQGDAKTALSKPDNIIITEKLARKFFSNEDPIGKIFRVQDNDFVVTAVIRDVPENSHLQFNHLFSFEAYKKFGWNFLENWNSNACYTYVVLREEMNHQDVTPKIKDAVQKHEEVTYKVDIYLQPLTSIHLHSKFTADIGGHGDAQYVYIFSIAGIFILLIACINFMNLSTARSANRSKEVGMRKAIGAQRIQLIRQFLAESILLSFIALGIALVIVQLLLPAFNTVSGKNLGFNLLSNDMLPALLLITLITGIIAGSYPALFLSGFKTVNVLKGTLKTGRNAVLFRKALVITQFCISILLITGTLVVYNQLDFIRNKKLGFEKKNILSFRSLSTRTLNENFKNELLASKSVTAVTRANGNLTYVGSSGSSFDWEGKEPDKEVLLHTLSVDHDYLKTFHIELAQGRDFSKDIASDSSAVILNEEAIRQMGIENPLNKKFSSTFGEGASFTIIGIVKDFHFKSVHEKIEPLVMFNNTRFGSFYVRVNDTNIQQNLEEIEATFKKFAPDQPFEYTFLDDDFDRLYRAEQRTGTIFNYFAFIAIFISCLGLFGLVMFTTEQRTKEIGVRKVLGASVSSVVSLISVDFIKLILVANLIAIPGAWYLMNRWLDSFAYHVNIHWVTFAVAAISSLIVAWLTMAYQSIKAAAANPVKSLRME